MKETIQSMGIRVSLCVKANAAIKYESSMSLATLSQQLTIEDDPCVSRRKSEEQLMIETVSGNYSQDTWGSPFDRDGSGHNTDRLKVLSPTTLHHAIELLFTYCEDGNADNLLLLMNQFSGLDHELNSSHWCYVESILMEVTPLQLAAMCGHASVVSLLMKHSILDVNAKDTVYLMTALHLAVVFNHPQIVALMISDDRFDPNARNVDGKTPISLAVEQTNEGLVEIMLKLCPAIDLRLKDFDGNNVYHAVAKHPNVAILQSLIDFFEILHSKDPHPVKFINYERKRMVYQVCSKLMLYIDKHLCDPPFW